MDVKINNVVVIRFAGIGSIWLNAMSCGNGNV